MISTVYSHCNAVHPVDVHNGEVACAVCLAAWRPKVEAVVREHERCDPQRNCDCVGRIAGLLRAAPTAL